jgi:hypothetical protein
VLRLATVLKHLVGVELAEPDLHILLQRLLVEAGAGTGLQNDPHEEVRVIDLEVQRPPHTLMPLKRLRGRHSAEA